MRYVLINMKKAKDYAIKFCRGGNDCPDGQFYPPAISDDFPYISLHNTDCCHFIAHVFYAGGLKVPGTARSCAKSLVVRAKELLPWLENAARTTANVKKLAGWQVAAEGDIVIQTKPDQGGPVPSHVMMVSGSVQADGARVFGHTNNRCGDEFVVFDATSAWFFRIEVPWDGAWTVTDTAKRFRLEIAGADVNWIERRQDGAELARQATMEEQGDFYVIRRNNDDAVLQFIGFGDAALRQAILAAGPKASYMVLSLADGKIAAKWNGIAVRKKPNGSFDSLIQPGTAPAKDFLFAR